ncbi:MAG: hypothetical protein PHS93_07770 [Candidatus Omnitrophica bacterium]|nr:hypothetical protein [Candidatus Omnitrophota bacterium]
MADKEKKRPWWLTTRLLGGVITVTGAAMWFIPVTHPIADKFITAGLAMLVGGQYSATTRNKFNGNSPVAKNTTTGIPK